MNVDANAALGSMLEVEVQHRQQPGYVWGNFAESPARTSRTVELHLARCCSLSRTELLQVLCAQIISLSTVISGTRRAYERTLY